jgi:hypothetical protein
MDKNVFVEDHLLHPVLLVMNDYVSVVMKVKLVVVVVVAVAVVVEYKNYYPKNIEPILFAKKFN